MYMHIYIQINEDKYEYMNHFSVLPV
jgi:hypothetical protein